MYAITDAVESLDPYLESFSLPLGTFEIVDQSDEQIFAGSNDIRIKTKYTDQHFFLFFGQDASNVTFQADVHQVSIWGKDGLFINGTKDAGKEYLHAHSTDHQVNLDFCTRDPQNNAHIFLAPKSNNTFFLTHDVGCLQWGIGETHALFPHVFLDGNLRRQGFNTSNPEATFHFSAPLDNAKDAQNTSFLFESGSNETVLRSYASPHVCLHFEHDNDQKRNSIISTYGPNNTQNVSLSMYANDKLCMQVDPSITHIFSDRLHASHDIKADNSVSTHTITASQVDVSEKLSASRMETPYAEMTRIHASNITVSEEINVPNIHVSSNLIIQKNAWIDVYGDINFQGNVNFNTEELKFNQPFYIESSIFVNDTATIQKELTVQGATELKDDLTLHGRFNLTDVWDVTSNQITFTQPLVLDQKLDANFPCVFHDTVTHHDDVFFEKNMIQRNGMDTHLGNLTVDGHTTLETLTVMHDFDIKGTFSIDEYAIFEGGIRVKNRDATLDTLKVQEESTFFKDVLAVEDVLVQQNLDVQGQFTTNKLVVTQDTVLNGPVNVNNQIDMHENVHMHKNVVIAQDLRIIGKLRLGSIVEDETPSGGNGDGGDDPSGATEPNETSFAVEENIESLSGFIMTQAKGFKGPSSPLSFGLFLYYVKEDGSHTIGHYDEDLNFIKQENFDNVTWVTYSNGLLYITYANGEISSVFPHNFNEFRRRDTGIINVLRSAVDNKGNLLLGRDSIYKHSATSLERSLENTVTVGEDIKLMAIYPTRNTLYVVNNSNSIYEIGYGISLARRIKHTFVSYDIHALTVDGQGNVYIGYVDSITSEYRAGLLDSALKVKQNMNYNFQGRINDIHRGLDGLIYVVTHEGTLFQFDADLRLIANAKLTDKPLYGVTWSFDGSLYVSGGELFKVDPRDLSVTHNIFNNARVLNMFSMHFEESDEFLSNSHWNPTYAWRDDSGTGIYHSSQGEIGISTNTHPVVIINDNGLNLLRDMQIQHQLTVMNDCHMYKNLVVDGVVHINGSIENGYNIQDVDADTITLGTLSVDRGGTGKNTHTKDKILVGNGTQDILSPVGLHWDPEEQRLGIGKDQPCYTLDVNGMVRIEDELICASDMRGKENIHDIEDALAKVMSMRGVYFNRKGQSKEQKRIGFIAQQVHEHVPELVQEDENTGYLSVAYANVTALLVEAVHEMQSEILYLKSQVSTLKNDLKRY